MQVEVKIRLTSPILGSKRSSRNVRTLIKDHSEDNIRFDLPRFDWAIREAARALNWEKLWLSNMIFPDEYYKKPTLITYEHNIRRKGVPKKDLYEAIRTGAVITWKFVLTDPPPGTPGKKNLCRPTVTQLEELLNFVGNYLGMSQTLNERGFGRFVVHKPETEKEDNAKKLRTSIYDVRGRNDADSRKQRCAGRKLADDS